MPDLTENWQQGDVSAFETLYRQYEKLVYRTAYLITGSKEAADDTLQEVFISVWRFRHTYDSNKGKLTTWLHRITVNECSRKKKRKPSTISLEEKMIDLPDMKHQSQPEDVLINKMEYERLLRAMDALDTKHRSILVLRYFNDLSYQEIAEALEIPLGTVKSRINQSLKYLKTQMNPGEAEA
ncbi:MAG: RNA polymerase sigma factor [Dehalococcoidales bacterium]|nr:RNA polymerase sigma factor [Dehalococcoidales bacterium]